MEVGQVERTVMVEGGSWGGGGVKEKGGEWSRRGGCRWVVVVEGRVHRGVIEV